MRKAQRPGGLTASAACLTGVLRGGVLVALSLAEALANQPASVIREKLTAEVEDLFPPLILCFSRSTFHGWNTCG